MGSFCFFAFLLSLIISQAVCLSLSNLNKPIARVKRQFEIQDGEVENVQVDDIEGDTDGSDFNGAMENFDDQPQQGGFVDQRGSNEEGQFEQPQGQGFPQNQQQGFADDFGLQQNQNQGSRGQGVGQNQQQGQNQGSQNQQQGFEDDFGGLQQNQNQGSRGQNQQQGGGRETQGQGQPQGSRGRGNPPTSVAPPQPTGTTTPRPQFTRCFMNCPVTPQYNPVCGTDSVTYSNEGRLNCARNCGANVQVASVGSCSG